MAIRLYPQTTNSTNLEILARVPTGTATKYAALEAKKLSEDAYYEELYADGNEELRKFNSFLVNGWGRVRQFESISGSTTNRTKVAELLNAQGVTCDPNLCEGLCWS